MDHSSRKLQQPGMANKVDHRELRLPPRAPPSTPPLNSFTHVHVDYKQRDVMITGMTIMGTMLFSALVLGIFGALARLYFTRRNHSRMISLPTIIFGSRDDFLDEDRRIQSDVNTAGLQQSIIDSITVFKYKKHEGLIEGNDQCPVCLNEFQEDESLRLLPKCTHGFHLPCIDTWLRSHRNCPLCRAPVDFEAMVAADQASASEPDSIDSSSRNETLVENPENRDETSELRASGSDVQVISDSVWFHDDVQAPIRRSVSLNLSSSMEIYGYVAGVRIEADEHHRISVTELEQLKYPKEKIVTKRGSESSSIGKLMKSSSIGRSSSKGPISMKRSFSSGGNFLLSKQSRSQDSIISM